MAGGLDSAGREVALDLITEFGTSILFTYVTNEGNYDPSDGSVAGRTTSTQTLVALPTTPKKGFRPGGVADDADLTILVPGSAPTGWAPIPGTIAEFGGEKYTAISVETVQPGILPILYKVHVQRGTREKN